MKIVYNEEYYIQLSAVQHYLFCPRQCALAYLELIWEDNMFTAQGNTMHETVHAEKKEKRKDLIKSYGIYLSSRKLGLTGQADLVEFYRVDKESEGVILPKQKGFWQPFPVEYKRGKSKKDNCDKVQLCAQALCLEEMLHCEIKNGALYYGEKKHRIEVPFDLDLRKETEYVISEVHKLFFEKRTPKAIYSPKCRSCSLINHCNPKQFELDRSYNYSQKIFEVL